MVEKSLRQVLELKKLVGIVLCVFLVFALFASVPWEDRLSSTIAPYVVIIATLVSLAYLIKKKYLIQWNTKVPNNALRYLEVQI